MADLDWRAPTRGDDEAWAALLAAIEAVDRHGETYELVDLADEWESVWAHPDTDAVFVWDGQELVAFGWLKTQPGQREQHRIACWGGVTPSHRGRGIGRALLGWQVDRARAVAATLDPALRTSILIDVQDGAADAAGLVRRAGFVPVRHFLEVARPLTDAPPVVVPVDGVEVRTWDDVLDEATRLAHVEAFADHWGSEPRSEAEWRQWYTGHRGFRPDLSRVALDLTTGTVVGFVLSAAYPQDWLLGPREVWINSVGTRREWRGRGVARALLADVLQTAAASTDRFDRAILGVDTANPTGALRLYRALGFEDVRATTTLELSPG